MTPRLVTLQARGNALASAPEQLRSLDRLALTHEFHQLVPDLRPTRIDTLQINVGKVCNQTCRHCHVDAGPDRVELMSQETMAQCLAALAATDIPTVDITGGAPEMNPHFEWLVTESRKLDRHVMDRCNLTILETNKYRHLPEFFAEHQVEVVSSLPHYRAPSTDTQRGDGVFEKSLAALRRLNAVGYGQGDPSKRLVLVTNPVGAFLPAAQRSLEKEWKRELARLHGIQFDALYCLTNMPISRYLEWLMSTGNLEAYMERLVTAFNPRAAEGVMCRSMVSVGWDGVLYDCDFNQMLDLPVHDSAPRHIRDFALASLGARPIVTARHCFGCTAGAGSSCGGAVA